jgi:hypothetical protein
VRRPQGWSRLEYVAKSGAGPELRIIFLFFFSLFMFIACLALQNVSHTKNRRVALISHDISTDEILRYR